MECKARMFLKITILTRVNGKRSSLLSNEIDKIVFNYNVYECFRIFECFSNIFI